MRQWKVFVALLGAVVLAGGLYFVVSVYRDLNPSPPSDSRSIRACRTAVVNQLDLPRTTRFSDERVENAYGGDGDPAVEATGLILDRSGTARRAYICYLDFDAHLYDLVFISAKEHMNRRAQERKRLVGTE